jgi:hypothetical protein
MIAALICPGNGTFVSSVCENNPPFCEFFSNGLEVIKNVARGEGGSWTLHFYDITIQTTP